VSCTVNYIRSYSHICGHKLSQTFASKNVLRPFGHFTQNVQFITCKIYSLKDTVVKFIVGEQSVKELKNIITHAQM
jgi:hypothetical protein